MFKLSSEPCHFKRGGKVFIYAGLGNKEGEILGQSIDNAENLSFPINECELIEYNENT